MFYTALKSVFEPYSLKYLYHFINSTDYVESSDSKSERSY